MSRYLSLSLFLALVVGAAAVGTSFEAGLWYFDMQKPSWTPPTWVFGPAWGLLYLLMAVAAWKVWDSGHYDRVNAITLWLIQLALNAAWSWIFFGLHRLGVAWLELSLLLLMVLLCIRAFHAISRPAAWMMLPYFAWLIFAWCLNFAIWNMNGGPAAGFFTG